MSTTGVGSGDAGYDVLYAKWQSEGSPNGSFERLGEFGGQLWRVRRDDDGEPVFFLTAAAGPSDPGHDRDIESWDWLMQPGGYLATMWDTGLEFEEGPGGDGDWKIQMEPFPLDHSVWTGA